MIDSINDSNNHSSYNSILVTGGCGFIGSNFVLDWLANEDGPVVNLDALTYAGNPENLASVVDDPRYTFVHGDICDAELLEKIFREHTPRAVVHFAAESHNDNSLRDPEPFVFTNLRAGTRLEVVVAWVHAQVEARLCKV